MTMNMQETVAFYQKQEKEAADIVAATRKLAQECAVAGVKFPWAKQIGVALDMAKLNEDMAKVNDGFIVKNGYLLTAALFVVNAAIACLSTRWWANVTNGVAAACMFASTCQGLWLSKDAAVIRGCATRSAALWRELADDLRGTWVSSLSGAYAHQDTI